MGKKKCNFMQTNHVSYSLYAIRNSWSFNMLAKSKSTLFFFLHFFHPTDIPALLSGK